MLPKPGREAVGDDFGVADAHKVGNLADAALLRVNNLGHAAVTPLIGVVEKIVHE